MNILQNPRSALTFITVATIIITAILAAVEASQLGFGSSSSGKKETGPIGFFFGILLLWVISYPYYLYQRRKKGKKNLLAGGIIVALVFMLSLLSMNVALSQAGFNFSMSSIGEYVARSKDAAAESDARNACTAQEAYYIDNERYADSINKLIGDYSATYGLYLSVNVKMHTSAHSNGQEYFIAAFHTKGSKVFSVSGPGGVISIESKEKVLRIVAEHGDYDFAEALITKGADVNAGDEKGFTPLMCAIFGGRTEIAKELIANGADVNARKDGITPLMFAAVAGRTEIAKELIANGADVNVKLENGVTALTTAENKGYPEIAKLLRKAAGIADYSATHKLKKTGKTEFAQKTTTVTPSKIAKKPKVPKHGGALAGGFSFLNISWNDGPEEVISKIEESGLADWVKLVIDFDDKPISDGIEKLIQSNLVDEERFQYLCSKARFAATQREKEEIGYAPYIKIVEMDGKYEGPVIGAWFRFPYIQGKLLGYQINLRARCTEEESDERLHRSYSSEPSKPVKCSAVYKGLIEKYGKPSKIMKYSEKWQSDEQSLYYFCPVGKIVLFYLNDKNIKEHMSNLDATVAKYKREKAGKQRDAVKKMF